MLASTAAEIALRGPNSISRAVKLVKQQTNGTERVVLKEDATLEDLRAEATRLKTKLGYEVKPDGHVGRYIATHRFFRGRFVLELEKE